MARKKFHPNPDDIIDKKNDETPKDTEKPTESTDNKTKPTKKKENTKNKTIIKNKESEEIENNKVGRPKGVPSTKISLNIPNQYLELVNIAAGLNYKGNTSSYINALIKEDIDKNKNIYEQIKEIKQAN